MNETDTIVTWLSAVADIGRTASERSVSSEIGTLPTSA